MRSEKRGWFWWDWYSICSRHRETRDDCRLCQTGRWQRRITTRLSSFFYTICPWGWRLWVNRKNSPGRRFLLRCFPNLQGKPGETPAEEESLKR